MKHQLLFLLGLVLPQLTHAATNIINFDDFRYGQLGFAASNHYQNAGVIFSRDIPIYSVAAVEGSWWAGVFSAGGGSLPNVMPLTRSVPSGTTIDVWFVEPGTTNQATTDFVGALLADTEVGSTVGRLEVFDIHGNLIGSKTVQTPATRTTNVVIRMPGIARARFTDTGDGCEVDNLSFGPLTPRAKPQLSIRISQVEISWFARSNMTYQLQYQSPSTTNIWVSLGEALVGKDETAMIYDDIAVGDPRKFYRLVEE